MVLPFNDRKQKISQFTKGTAITNDTQYSSLQGGINKTFTQQQILDDVADVYGASLRTFATESALIASDIALDEYAIVEENLYSLYKITSIAPSQGDVTLTSGFIATHEATLDNLERTDYTELLNISPTVLPIGSTVEVTNPGIAGTFVLTAGVATGPNGVTVRDANYDSAGVHWRRAAGPIQVVDVLWFEADPTGATPSTEAFNNATMSDYSSTGNFDQTFPGEVYVPAGIYQLDGTVYIHKGQHLRGSGVGATKIDCSGMTAFAGPVFLMGHSESGPDVGGLPPEISEMWTFGGPAAHGIIESGVAGSSIHNLFMTSPGIGIDLTGGGDVIIENIFSDQGLTGLRLKGQNHVISGILFFNMNYAVTFLDESYDIQIADSHFEYTEFDDMLFSTGASEIKNISVSDCQFIKNSQYATSEQSINIRTTDAEINFDDCAWRNQRQFSVNVTTGLGNVLKFSGCTFDGNKTVAGYTQSTTAAGIKTQNAHTEITDCTFRNLLGDPIQVNSTFDYPTIVKGCSYDNISNATEFVNITGTTGDLTISDCVGDDVLPLINLQNSIEPVLRNNKRWIGARQESGGRYYWEIPTYKACMARVGITANSNPAGNALYRKVSSIYASRHVDNNGSEVRDFATLNTIYETPAGFAPVLDIQVDLDTVGGGSNATYVDNGRYLAVSIPNTYTNEKIEIDYEV